jgi:hypothetical protein
LEFGTILGDQPQEYTLGHLSLFLAISMRYIAITIGITWVPIKLKCDKWALQNAILRIGALTTGGSVQ